MRTESRIAVVMAAVALAACGSAAAHELIVPATVEADGAGHFRYDVVVIITESAPLAWVEVDGLDNTDIGAWIGDGFCLQTVEPGSYPYTMEGNLLDPETDGTVWFAQAMCDGWAAADTTVIVAPSVDNVPAVWGSVKGMYR